MNPVEVEKGDILWCEMEQGIIIIKGFSTEVADHFYGYLISTNNRYSFLYEKSLSNCCTKLNNSDLKIVKLLYE